ncbi:response regulator [bacterium]|nr:response regulator [bacterium]
MTQELRLLLIEDSEDDLLLILRELNRRGYAPDYERVETAAELTAKLAEGPWDIILSDFKLPGFSGREALNIVKSTQEDIPFIIVSGTIGEETAVEVMKAGAHDYIMKDKLARLVPAIERELREAETRRQRRAMESRLRLLVAAVEQSDEAMIITDRTGRIQYANQSFGRIYNFDHRAAIGRPVTDVLAADERNEAVVHQAWEQLNAGHSWRGRFTNRRTDGSVIEIDASISPIKNDSGEIIHFVSTERDVTDRLILEKKLIQTQRMEALGTLAGGIAHDFNNILFAILGYADLALDKLPRENTALLDIHEIKQAGQRARDLITQILSFARQAEQQRAPVQVGSIVAEVLKLLRATLPSTIKIDARLPAKQEKVIADPIQLHQILMNLCTNAGQALARTGGTLLVSLTEANFDQPRPLIHPLLGAGKYVVLEVSDDGPGMTPTIADRVFEPFFTTKPKTEGTGMGLAVVHGIVTDLGGVITLNTAPGAGATFTVFLPKAPPAELKPEQKPRGLPTGNEHVLFVDDEMLLAHMVKEMLAGLGYQVTAFTSSPEALEAFQAKPERFDIVVTDQTMPGLTGGQLAEKLLAIRPELPIIVCTGFSEVLHEADAEAIGIRAYMNKPITRRELAEVIRRTLDGEPAD